VPLVASDPALPLLKLHRVGGEIPVVDLVTVLLKIKALLVMDVVASTKGS
jgi:hypothetical protein